MHPLMERREGANKRGIVVVSTDKGLCGALNSNLMREAAKFDKTSTVYITAGRKASQFIARTKRNLAAEFTYKDAPLFSEARAISKFARDLFTEGGVDRVDVLFTNFISTLNQRPEVFPLLPVGELKGVTAGVHGHATSEKLLKGANEFLFEPGVEAVLGALLPHYLNFQIYQILLEAQASEHRSRMVAMKKATDNAEQLIKKL